MPVEVWVDSNVVVHYLTGHPPDKAAACGTLFHRAQRGEAALYIHPITIAETIWVLESLGVERQAITENLVSLTLSDAVHMDQRHVVQLALLHYRDLNIDFVDAFLAALASRGISTVATYNARDLRRVEGCRPVLPDQV